MATLNYWLWLMTREGVGPTTATLLLDRFVTPERVYYAEPEEYDIPFLPAKVRASLQKKAMDEAERILESCDRLGLDIMTIQDADYPERLRQLVDPPLLLYIKGRRIWFDNEVAVAVVGARACSEYGRRMASKLALEIVTGGGLIVTGMAQGIDTAAIQGALRGGGTVVSVLAGGLDVVYPKESRFLYDDVAAVGALISEYPPGTRHKGEHFPIRNRLISGLALGVVVPECKIHSGSMITVRRALEQDRDVFALPGYVDAPMSRGPNLLIQQGAKLVTTGEDILTEYRHLFPVKLSALPLLDEETQAERLNIPNAERRANIESKERPEITPELPKLSVQQQKERFTDDQIAVLQILQQSECSVDELVEQTQIPARRISTALTMLQVAGDVQESGNRRFTTALALEII